jgi:uncharacterized protein (TIGR00730 family)
MRLKSVCVYCGSSPGLLPAYLVAARKFGELLATRSVTLVYGGGNVGLMGAVANGALAKGGAVVGVMPRQLIAKEVAHDGLTELHAVDSMHERKMKMADLADAFVALPGGIGTLEEVFEAWTWTQLGFHGKPVALLDVEGFYAQLLGFLRHVVGQRFVRQEHFDTLLVDDDPVRLLDALDASRPVLVDKWVDRRKDA